MIGQRTQSKRDSKSEIKSEIKIKSESERKCKLLG